MPPYEVAYRQNHKAERDSPGEDEPVVSGARQRLYGCEESESCQPYGAYCDKADGYASCGVLYRLCSGHYLGALLTRNNK